MGVVPGIKPGIPTFKRQRKEDKEFKAKEFKATVAT